MKKDQRHSNTRGTSKATNRQSGTSCSNTPTSKKAAPCLSNSTPQARTTSKKEYSLAGNTATIGKTSQKRTKNKKTSALNTLKTKSTKRSAGKPTSRNASATTKGKSAKRKSKPTCSHSYELSVPYSLEGKRTVKQYYRNKKGRHVCHYKCTKCNDRTIAWSDQEIKTRSLNPMDRFNTPCYLGGIMHKTCGGLGADCCWCTKHNCPIGKQV